MRGSRVLASLTVAYVCCASHLHAQQSDSGSDASENVNVPAALRVAAGTVPRAVSFSGVVQHRAGRVQTGVVGLTLSVYERQEGGTPLWVETQNAQLDEQGRYTVLLGTTQPNGLPLDLFTTGRARWLGIRPHLPGEGEQPRVLLVGMP